MTGMGGVGIGDGVGWSCVVRGGEMGGWVVALNRGCCGRGVSGMVRWGTQRNEMHSDDPARAGYRYDVTTFSLSLSL